jgi:Ni/Fe-hydrogenase subunit HybB-like protein
MSSGAVPVGGPILTRAGKILLSIILAGLVVTIWRFMVGLGPSTALNDGYPWGIWIAFDVVTGTALACGGYAMALLVYIFNRGHYHPLVRPALLTSALGYSVAAIAIIVDVGRPWFIYRIPLSPGKWNLNSALLEVALCVMAYVIVLWIELSPAFLEKWGATSKGALGRLAQRLTPIMDRALLWIIALGILLPTMHQSSLGTVMLLAGPRLHPLWHTPWIPLLFLISCIAMGYAVVVMESALASRFFGRKREDGMLASLSGVMSLVLFLFIVIRVVDLVARGRLGLMFGSGVYSFMFLLELVLVVVPAFMLLRQRRQIEIGALFRAAMMIALAGTLYRFNAYLVAFNPGPGWSYFPSIPEMFITVAFIATEILLYVVLVKRFPILGGAVPAAAAR